MTTALTGAIGWAPQIDRYSFGIVGSTEYHAGRMVNLALSELTQPFDQEIGGSLLPAGMMKLARWAQGDFECYPRTQKSIGWLLYSLVGAVASTGSATAGYRHRFPGTGVRDATIPNKWLTVRRITPADDENYYIGETFVCCKVTQVAFTIAAGAILSARFSFTGLHIGDLIVDPDEASPAWSVTTEDSAGVPVAPESNVVFSDGTPFDALQQITITIANNVQDARQELQVGSYSPRNVTMLGRNVTLAGTRFYDDPAMYRKIRYGGASSVNWDKKIFYGGNLLSMIFRTQDETLYGTGNDVAGEIGFSAKRVGWAAEPLQLQGGNPIAMQVTGTVVKGAAAETEDWQVWLLNDEATYTWPTGTPVTISTQTVETGDPDAIVLTFSGNAGSWAPPGDGFTITIEGDVYPVVSYSWTSATELKLTTAYTWVNGDTGTIAYDKTLGHIFTVSDGSALESFSAVSITNNVT